MTDIKTMKVEEVPRTKKIFSETQDVIVLELINQAIGEVIYLKPIQTWNEIANVIQAAQLTYESIKFKPKEKSNRKKNVM